MRRCRSRRTAGLTLREEEGRQGRRTITPASRCNTDDRSPSRGLAALVHIAQARNDALDPQGLPVRAADKVVQRMYIKSLHTIVREAGVRSRSQFCSIIDSAHPAGAAYSMIPRWTAIAGGQSRRSIRFLW